MRSAVNRLVGVVLDRARILAAGVYRDVIGRETSPAFRLIMLAAAGFDGTAAFARRLAGGDQVRRLQAGVAAAGVRIAHRSGLVVAGAVIGSPDQVSVRLTGPAAARDRVRTLRLDPVGGGGGVDLDTCLSLSGDVVRLVATLPNARFDAAASCWRLVVTDGAHRVDAVVADRSAVLDRWRDRDGGWPPRLSTDAGRNLIISGVAPAGTDVAHRVLVGTATATVEWDGPAGRPGALRLQTPDGSRTIVVDGAPHPNRAAGSQRAVIHFHELVAPPCATWRASIRRPADADGWQPVQLPCGSYPGAWPPPHVAELPVRRADGSAALVRVAYGDDGGLSFTVAALP